MRVRLLRKSRDQKNKGPRAAVLFNGKDWQSVVTSLVLRNSPDLVASLLRWGILGTGNIAHAFASGLAHSLTGKLVAAGSRSAATSMRFGQEYGLAADSCHASYEALLADPKVEAVYISNPHPGHAEWAIRCAQAGKHILCEKPLAMNHRQAACVVEAARRHDVFLMEAFMYRCHPQTARIVELIREGAIGEVRVIPGDIQF